MHSRILYAALLLLIVYSRDRCAQRALSDTEQARLLKSGEFNDRCRSTKDCRSFGYVCRENRTCQCDFMYIPDAGRQACVGGVNQRCIYDEHCIEGAFCMNQAICKCKDSSPMELDEGLVCSGSTALTPRTLAHFFLWLTVQLYVP